MFSTDDRHIARLAIPALGALAAEPLYVLVDTAIVGHIGVPTLAALALAGVLLTAVTTLCNFLEYGATPQVGRLHAVGDDAGAARVGRQAVTFAMILGIGLALALEVAAGPLLSLLGGRGRVHHLAVLYLRIAAGGIPCTLVSVAAGGYFRGVARLAMPLMILLAGNLLNAVLEVGLVYGLGWGIAGSAAGTLTAQLVMAIAYWRAGGWPAPVRAGGFVRPDVGMARSGSEIFVRTAALYASFLIAGGILARVGAASLAAHQIAFQLWNFLALALDALAVAAQVLVSHALARREVGRARELSVRVLWWSLAAGVLFGALLMALEPVLPRVFTSDPRVLNRADAVWPLFAAMQPVNAVAFALDGILLGASDTRFLARAMIPCSVLVFAPLALFAYASGWGIIGIWIAIFAFIAGPGAAHGPALPRGWLERGWGRLRGGGGSRDGPLTGDRAAEATRLNHGVDPRPAGRFETMTTDTSDFAIVPPDEATDAYAGSDVPGEFRRLTDLLGAEQVALTLIRVPPHSDFEQGTGHFHDETEELYLVTRGRLTMRFGDEIRTVTAPSAVRVAPRTPRSHRNEGDELVEMWAISQKRDGHDATKIDAFWEASPDAAQHR